MRSFCDERDRATAATVAITLDAAASAPLAIALATQDSSRFADAYDPFATQWDTCCSLPL